LIARKNSNFNKNLLRVISHNITWLAFWGII